MPRNGKRQRLNARSAATSASPALHNVRPMETHGGGYGATRGKVIRRQVDSILVHTTDDSLHVMRGVLSIPSTALNLKGSWRCNLVVLDKIDTLLDAAVEFSFCGFDQFLFVIAQFAQAQVLL